VACFRFPFFEFFLIAFFLFGETRVFFQREAFVVDVTACGPSGRFPIPAVGQKTGSSIFSGGSKRTFVVRIAKALDFFQVNERFFAGFCFFPSLGGNLDPYDALSVDCHAPDGLPG